MANTPKAFIDNGQIKIVNSEGIDFSESISERAKALAKSRFLCRFFIVAMLTFGFITCSPLFFNFISGWQIGFFLVLTIVSVLLAGGFSDDISAKKKEQTEMIAEHNLAKEALQGKVMQLQCQLAQHNSEIQQIQNQAKFNFKKSEEMTV